MSFIFVFVGTTHTIHLLDAPVTKKHATERDISVETTN
jgi:hypothetical protein